MASDMFGDSSLFEEFERERQHNLCIPSHSKTNDYNLNDASESKLLKNEENFSCLVSTREQYRVSISSESSSECEELGDDEHNGQTNATPTDDTDSSRSFRRTESDNCNKQYLNQRSENELKLPNSEYYKTKDLSEKNAFENKQLKKFTRLIDTTRSEPLCDESPCIQIVYQNNKFARMYREEIEQFLFYLIHKDDNQPEEKIPELKLEARTLSAATLSSSHATNHHMKRIHAFLGCSQMYHDFVIDTLGWPLVQENPALTHSWQTSQYDQYFQSSLPCDECVEMKPQPKRNKAMCFNCSGDHVLSNCPQPHDMNRIRSNRRAFRDKSAAPKLGLSANSPREDNRFQHLKPGVFSEDLREALGLSDNQLPPFIYSMRLLGYPPGWEYEATKQTSGISLFDKHGQEVGIDGETINTSEGWPPQQSLNKLDVQKIIEFPGFTVETPQQYVDECHLYNAPPVLDHQLKSTAVRHQKEQENEKKRRFVDKKDMVRKRMKLDTQSDMDIDSEETIDLTGNSPYQPLLPEGSSPCRPPLPEGSSPYRPPLPEGSSPYRPPLPEGNSPYRPPLPEGNSPYRPSLPEGSSLYRQLSDDCIRTPTSLSQCSTPSSQPSTADAEADYATDAMSLEDLEKKYEEIKNAIDSNSDAQGMSDNSVGVPTATDAILMSPPERPSVDFPIVENSSVAMEHAVDSPVAVACDTDSPKKASRSIELSHGTPVNASVRPALPERRHFGSGIEDHLPYENLPESTGRFDKLRTMLKNLRAAVFKK